MTGQSVLGVIENLSYLETEQGKNFLFGEGGGKAVAQRLSELSGQAVPLLGQIPISQVLRASADMGVPVVVSDAEDPAAKVIEGIAAAIAKVPRGLSGKKLGLNPI
jgi:ATP-binding protein involved in chromosome partitioning